MNFLMHSPAFNCSCSQTLPSCSFTSRQEARLAFCSARSGFLAAICVICMLKPHPPSTYAHDAKWCTFGLWLCMMVYPLYYICKGHKYTKAGDFFVALTLSMESVVLGWIVCIFQARAFLEKRSQLYGFCCPWLLACFVSER